MEIKLLILIKTSSKNVLTNINPLTPREFAENGNLKPLMPYFDYCGQAILLLDFIYKVKVFQKIAAESETFKQEVANGRKTRFSFDFASEI